MVKMLAKEKNKWNRDLKKENNKCKKDYKKEKKEWKKENKREKNVWKRWKKGDNKEEMTKMILNKKKSQEKTKIEDQKRTKIMVDKMDPKVNKEDQFFQKKKENSVNK